MTKKRRKDVTIRDVAKAAGVSTATVSRCINGTGNVPAATRDLIEEVVARLDYKYASANAGDKQTDKTTVGIIIPDMLNPFFASLLDGIHNQTQRHGFSLELGISNNDVRAETEIAQSFIKRGLYGLIITPSDQTAPYAKQLRNGERTCIFVDRIVAEADNWVISDDVEGAYQAAKYLLDLNHRNILFIGGKSWLSTEKDRVAGFKKALQEDGMAIDEDLISEVAFDSKSAYLAIKDILKRGVPFSAVMAADDMIAIGVRKALLERGLRIPEDISLIGYGDMHFSEYLSLSTVSSPSHEIGKTAFLLLLDFLHGRVKKPQQIKLRPSLVIRSSCLALT